MEEARGSCGMCRHHKGYRCTLGVLRDKILTIAGRIKQCLIDDPHYGFHGHAMENIDQAYVVEFA